MKKIIGVILKENGQVYYCLNESLEINIGDYVIIETDKGQQYAKVTNFNDNNDSKENIFEIIRVANKDDSLQFEKNKTEALKAIKKADLLAKDLNLNMKFIDSNFSFDRSQLVFSYTSESRIDFRELAKELASIYKTRIELWQIGVRDKAKEVSGIGQCGRELCCSCFLKDSMVSVSINMAKNQNFALNPSKINGQCGRLLCCLNYEDDVYSYYRSCLPELGSKIETKDGNGIVCNIDILNGKYTVLFDDNERIDYSIKSKCDECGKCNQ